MPTLVAAAIFGMLLALFSSPLAIDIGTWAFSWWDPVVCSPPTSTAVHPLGGSDGTYRVVAGPCPRLCLQTPLLFLLPSILEPPPLDGGALGRLLGVFGLGSLFLLALRFQLLALLLLPTLLLLRRSLSPLQFSLRF